MPLTENTLNGTDGIPIYCDDSQGELSNGIKRYLIYYETFLMVSQ